MIELPPLEHFGDHLILGMHNPSLSDKDKKLLNEVRPIGILFHEGSFLFDVPYEQWLYQFKTLLEEIKQYTEREQLFFTIDHEGGHGHRAPVRIPPPITRFPYACLLGEHARHVAKATAEELLACGINVTWAPVADIHSNAKNPVIGPRAFANSAEECTQRIADYYHGLNETGILGCLKHFPGHGDTATDSHFSLPVVSATLEELRDRELIPFRNIIQLCDVPFIMTAHIVYPHIDPHCPATLSKPFLTNILREEFGFKGVTVADDLDMKAIADDFMYPETLQKAFLAGCDMFIVSRAPYLRAKDRTRRLASNFASILSDGKEEVLSSIETSRKRIHSLLKKTSSPSVAPLKPEVFAQHHTISLHCSFGV